MGIIVLQTNKIRGEMDLGVDSEAAGAGEAVVAAVSGEDVAVAVIGVVVGATVATETAIRVVVGATMVTETATAIVVAAAVSEAVLEAVAVAVAVAVGVAVVVSMVGSPGAVGTIMTDLEDRGETTAIGEVGVALGAVSIGKSLSIFQGPLKIKRSSSTINDRVEKGERETCDLRARTFNFKLLDFSARTSIHYNSLCFSFNRKVHADHGENELTMC